MRSNPLRLCLSVLLCLQVAFSSAETLYSGRADLPAYIARIQAHDPAELSRILQHLDHLLTEDQNFASQRPLALVLHGDEIRAFLRQNYEQNQPLVDLAQKLSQNHALDIQICETWLRGEKIGISELPDFVATVPYGPAVEKALLEQGYEYF